MLGSQYKPGVLGRDSICVNERVLSEWAGKKHAERIGYAYKRGFGGDGSLVPLCFACKTQRDLGGESLSGKIPNFVGFEAIQEQITKAQNGVSCTMTRLLSVANKLETVEMLGSDHGDPITTLSGAQEILGAFLDGTAAQFGIDKLEETTTAPSGKQLMVMQRADTGNPDGVEETSSSIRIKGKGL
mgnify:CR=1 FL=1